MTFNNCSECGVIRETATIRLNSIVSKIEHRLYCWRNNHYGSVEGREPTEMELWLWKEELKKLLKEI